MKRTMWVAPAAAILLCPILLLGCATTNGPGAANSASAIAFARGLQARTSDPASRPLVKVNNETRRGPGFTTFTGWWCPKHADIKDLNDVHRKFVEFCQSHGGVFEGSVCLDEKNPSQVMFLLEFRSTRKCGNDQTADIFIAEADRQPTTTEFVTVLREHGYRSP